MNKKMSDWTSNNWLIESLTFPFYSFIEVMKKGYKKTVEEQKIFDNGIDATIAVAKILTGRNK